MVESINAEDTIVVIKGIADAIEKNIDCLTTLDQAIGDGDHGINLGNGFRVVKQKIDEQKGKDIGSILKSVGQTLISNVGGAIGPLYGMAFMRAGATVTGKNEINLSDVANMFEAAEQGIINIGKASLGEKTMLDAAHPAVLAMRKAAEEKRSLIEALEISVNAAEEGVKSTVNMVSKRGRSSYLGERSRGHQDVGATSSYMILKSVLDTLKNLRMRTA